MHTRHLHPFAFFARRLASLPIRALILSIGIGLLCTAVLADADGPDAWRVTGVAQDDTLNVRMGPGTAWPVIGTFGPNARGLQQVTCVPLVRQNEWMAMTPAERQALPQRWCLMQAADRKLTGWVAARYLMEDGADVGNAAQPAASAAVKPPSSPDGTARSTASGSCTAPTPTAGTAATSLALLEAVQRGEEAFVRARGFEPDDVLQTSLDGYYDPARFANQEASVFQPDRDLGSIARAMLLFDYAEGVIAHPRYRITYHIQHYFDDCDLIPRAYLEITRFNLGQTRYNDVIQYVDKKYRPPLDVFEPGPHVSRRFAMGPVQGMAADVKQSSRRTLNDAEAASADCLGEPCLALQDASGPSGKWNSATPPASESAIYREPAYGWAPGPARMAEMLYVQATGSSDEIESSEATSSGHPDITIIVSRDVYGQDSNTHGLLQWQGLMDDSIDEEWLRLSAVPDSRPELQKHIVYRRGGA